MQREAQPFTVLLNQSLARQPQLVGNAAARLATLVHHDLPVLAGFVVTTYVFDTAPHGEVTPDVEAAIEEAWQQLELSTATVRPSVYVPSHPAVATFDALLEHPQPVTQVTQVARAVENIWRSSGTASVTKHGAAQHISADDLQVAVLMQQQPAGASIEYSDQHIHTTQPLTSVEATQLHQLAERIYTLFDQQLAINFVRTATNFAIVGVKPSQG